MSNSENPTSRSAPPGLSRLTLLLRVSVAAMQRRILAATAAMVSGRIELNGIRRKAPLNPGLKPSQGLCNPVRVKRRRVLFFGFGFAFLC